MMTNIRFDRSIGRRIIAFFVLAAFLLTSGISPIGYAYAEEVLQLSQPGIRVGLSLAFAPPLLKGVKVYPSDPFRLDFILDKGDSHDPADQLKADSTRLIKYFLASLTVPEKDLWVNLSPYEKDRIVPDAFGVTAMGRDLLAQDYMLKQITASVIYPEETIGKEFWSKVYTEAQKRFGTTDIPVDTFNKVWIVPEKAVVYENKDSAYVVESRLKVLLEEDYLALEKGSSVKGMDDEARESNKLGAEIIREVVIPILEKEVNEGKNFAQLRQVYYSLILAIWFKDKIKESILGKAYIDQDKIVGVDIENKADKEKIWTQYVEAFKKGAYNYIKEDIDSLTQQTVSRKYFSGGAGLYRTREVILKTNDSAQLPQDVSGRAIIVKSHFKEVPGVDQSMVDKELDVVVKYAQPSENHFDPKFLSAVLEMLAMPDQLAEFQEVTRLVSQLLEGILLDEKLKLEFKREFQISWLSYAKLMLSRGRQPLKVVDVRGWLENPQSKKLIIAWSSVKRLQPFPFRILRTIQYFVKLSPAKQEAYLKFVERVKTVPVDSEAVWFTGRLLTLLNDVRDEDVERFLQQAFLMANHYIYYQYPEQRERNIPADLLGVFDDIAWLKNDLPDIKARFLASAVRVQDLKAVALKAQSKTYSLPSLPGVKFSLEELFGFVNSDNFSVFDTFEYESFSASKRPFIRAYDGIPLTMLHGTNEYKKIIADANLAAQVRNPTYPSSRNGKYIYFGSPYDHFSRNPGHFLMGDEWFYGNVVFEFPYFRLKPESKILFHPRGKLFAHPYSSDRKDADGQSIPEDIVEKGLSFDVVPEGARIYYASEKERQELQSALNAKGFKIPLIAQEQAADLSREMHDQSRIIVDQYIDEHPELMESLSQLRDDLEKALIDHARKLLNVVDLPPLVQSYLHQYAVIEFSEISGPLYQSPSASNNIEMSMKKVVQPADDNRSLEAIQDALIKFFQQPTDRVLSGLSARKRWRKTEAGFQLDKPSGMIMGYHIGARGQGDEGVQKKLVAFGEWFRGELLRKQPTLDGKIIFNDPSDYHVTVADIVTLDTLDKIRLQPKLQSRVQDATTHLLERFPQYRQSVNAEIVGIDMFINEKDGAPGVLKFRVEIDNDGKRLLHDFTRVLWEELNKDPEIEKVIYRASNRFSKEITFHITLGQFYDQLTPMEIETLVDTMKVSTEGERHIKYKQPMGRLCGYSNSYPLFYLGSNNFDRLSETKYKFQQQDILVEKDFFRSDKIDVQGQFIAMDPREVDVRVSVEPDMVNRDLVDDPVAKRKEGAGRSIEELVNDPATPEYGDILMAFNGITGNFYEANSAVLIDGKLIVKGKGAKGVGQKTYEPLNGKFWFLPLDPIAPNEDPIKEALIENGELKTDLGHKNGIFGAVIIRDGQSTISQDKDSENKYIGLGFSPAVRGQDVSFTKGKREAISAMGYTKDGKLFRATLTGDSNDRSRGEENEPNIEEFVAYLLQKGVSNAIVMGTVADVKTYIKEADEPFAAAKERMGVISKEGLLDQEKLKENTLSSDEADRVFSLLVGKGVLQIDPGSSTRGILNKFSSEIESLISDEFGQESSRVFSAIKSTCGESFLGNVFAPKARPNGTHIVVYKKRPDVIKKDILNDKGVRIPAWVWTFDPKQYKPYVIVAEELEGMFRLDRKTNRIFDKIGRPIGKNELRSKVPLIEDLLERFNQQYPDLEVVGVTGNENLFYNAPVVTIVGHRVYHALNEDIEGRDYPMYVVWQDGTVTIEEHVRFELDQERKNAKVKINGEDREIAWATGIQLILNEQGFVRPDNKLSYFFDDLKHLFVMPVFTKDDHGVDKLMSDGVFFMADQILSDPQRIDRYFQNPEERQSFKLSVTLIQEDGSWKEWSPPPELLKERLLKKGYEEEDFTIQDNQVLIRLKENGYPWHIVGITADNQVKEIAITSDGKDKYGDAGATIREVVQWLKTEKIVRAGIIDQGTTVFLKAGQAYYVDAIVDGENRDEQRASSIIVYAQPKKDNAMLNPGGIDLTRDKAGLQVQSAGSGVQFNFDPAMVEQLKNASGLTPVIIDIRPMTTTVPVFLGINDGQVGAEALSMR